MASGRCQSGKNDIWKNPIMTAAPVNKKPEKCCVLCHILTERQLWMTERQMDDGLDSTDRRLIELLRGDGRLPAATLAKILNVSRGTVQNRIDRLIERRVIMGFTIRLRDDVEAGLIRAQTALEVRANYQPVIEAMKRIAEVRRIFTTNGRWDVVAELAAPDLATLDRALAELRSIPGVAASETNILLKEV